MFFDIKLKKEPFENIVSRSKTIELRLLDDKRKQLEVGDYIKFVNLSNENEVILTKILKLTKADTFESLFEILGVDNQSMGFSNDMTKSEMADAMSEYYSNDEQYQYGVVGITIEVIFATADIRRITNKIGFEKDIEFNFYLLHDAVANALKEYKYNKKEFGYALAYISVLLLDIADSTGYDIFDELKKATEKIKTTNQ